MLNKLILAAIASLCVMTTQAQDLTIKLWDNATAPHSNGLSGEDKDEGQERISNTNVAELFIYEADPAKATGQAVVICPGGGYRLLAMGHEGHQYAEWMAENGITTAVLKYRLPNTTPQVPMEDAAEALRYMREEYRGKESIKQLGIMGFSAGGHLAASTAVGCLKANGDTSARAALRPDFAVLFYPVITGNPSQMHKGSYDKLLGSNRTQELTDKWSPELVAGKDAPQTLLILSSDDATVPPINSTKFYNTLKELGVPASITILPSGGHGWGFRDTFKYKAIWQETMLQWLESFRK
ncbi:MAG: alpha/beta hydrolase [Alistipes sp.]|nr:alpha/beta hydrolase [Alistipes sp.]